MLRNVYSDEDMEGFQQPPYTEASKDHKLWPLVQSALCRVYDPEIPVNIYELGLIYKVDIDDKNVVHVKMTLTSPGCPVAGEMPEIIADEIKGIENIGKVIVEVVWDPPWDPSKISETAKLQLGMF